MMVLFELKFEINLFSIVAFLVGMFSGFVILGLLYLLGCITSLRKKTIKINKEIENITEKDIKAIIDRYQKGYRDERKRNKTVPVEYFKKTIWQMMNEIAGKFYPKSKRPLFELSINELILLDRYIVSKIEELLSKRGLSLFRGLKLSTIFKLLDAKTAVDNNVVVKTARKYKFKQIADIITTALNFINPYTWFKKLIINPSIKLLTNKIFLVCFALIGEETYKVYSKQAFIEEDQQLSQLIDKIDNEGQKIEQEGIILENQVEEVYLDSDKK